MYQCEFCDAKFNLRSELKDHLRLQHTKTEEYNIPSFHHLHPESFRLAPQFTSTPKSLCHSFSLELEKPNQSSDSGYQSQINQGRDDTYTSPRSSDTATIDGAAVGLESNNTDSSFKADETAINLCVSDSTDGSSPGSPAALLPPVCPMRHPSSAPSSPVSDNVNELNCTQSGCTI